MSDLLRMATTSSGRARALEIALAAHVLLNPRLLAGRRRPRLAPAARLLIEAIERQRPQAFPEGLEIDWRAIEWSGCGLGDGVPTHEAVARLAHAVATTTCAELAAFVPVDVVCELVGAVPYRKARRSRAEVEADIAGGNHPTTPARATA